MDEDNEIYQASQTQRSSYYDPLTMKLRNKNSQKVLSQTFSQGSFEFFGNNKPNMMVRNYYLKNDSVENKESSINSKSNKQKNDRDTIIYKQFHTDTKHIQSNWLQNSNLTKQNHKQNSLWRVEENASNSIRKIKSMQSSKANLLQIQHQKEENKKNRKLSQNQKNHILQHSSLSNILNHQPKPLLNNKNSQPKQEYISSHKENAHATNFQNHLKTYDFDKVNYNSQKQFKLKHDYIHPNKMDSIRQIQDTSKKESLRQTKNLFKESKSQSNIYSNHTQQKKENKKNQQHQQMKDSLSQNAQILKFGNRELYLPLQTLKQMNTQKKYEKSQNSFFQCNNLTLSDKEMTSRRSYFPFRVNFDSQENKFNLKDTTETIGSAKFIPQLQSKKFIRIDGIQGSSHKISQFYASSNRQINRQQRQLCLTDVEENNLTTTLKNKYNYSNNEHSVENSKMGESNNYFGMSTNKTKDESDKQNSIMTTLKNRKEIGNLIRLIEEFPYDCINGNTSNLKYNQSEYNIREKNVSIQRSIESEFNPHKFSLDNPDFLQTDDLEQNSSSKINISSYPIEQQSTKDRLRVQDISFTEQAKQVEQETKQYILNKEKLYDFMPLRAKKERKNLDGKAHRLNLMKILNYLKSLNLKPRELLNNHVFSKKAFEKAYSYNLITAAKHNDIIQCSDLLSKNKYLVYDFDFMYMTALHWSCKRGHAKLCQLLIDKGADVNALDILGKPPLYFAAEQGHLDVVRVLLYNKAYPWSTKYINYEQFERQYPLISSALLTARKISVLLKMTSHKQRHNLWQKKGIAFEQILN